MSNSSVSSWVWCVVCIAHYDYNRPAPVSKRIIEMCCYMGDGSLLAAQDMTTLADGIGRYC